MNRPSVNASLPVGTRVAVDEQQGRIVQPTAEELAHAALEYDGTRWTLLHVLVQFDGDEDWDRGWYHPDELKVIT